MAKQMLENEDEGGFRLDTGEGGGMMYREDSIRELTGNDSLRYETSFKDVMKEFAEYQKKMFLIISNREKTRI